MDVALVHAPQNIMRNRPIQFCIIPMGEIMLANLLNQEGFTARVFHLGIEQEKGRTPEGVISAIKAPIFAIDIHWYVHLYDAVQVAALCKRLHPESTVIVGGMTASHFALDLISKFPSIDIVVRGDAELPFLGIVESYLEGRVLASVPNLVYRIGEQPVGTPLQYVTTDDALSELPYVSEMLPLNHADTYLHREMNGEPCFPTFWFCCGRGCLFDCCWCGGAAAAHQRLAGRSTMISRDPERVVQDIVLLASKLNMVSLSHDVMAMGRSYALQLFSLIRKENLDIGAYWEIFDPSLYSREVLTEIARTFNSQRSKIAVSLGSAIPDIRKESGMAAFSNAQFFSMLRHTRALGIQAEGYFHILPSETYKTFEATLKFLEIMQREVKVPFFYWSATLDPESPMHANPQAFGLTSRMHTFADYWHELSKGSPFVGYDLPHFREKDMLALSAGRTESMPENIATLYNKVASQRNALIGLTHEGTDIAFEALFI